VRSRSPCAWPCRALLLNATGIELLLGPDFDSNVELRSAGAGNLLVGVAGAVLLTWIYLRTAGSVLVAGLTHGALNATVPLTWRLDDAWVWQARAGIIGVIARAGVDTQRAIVTLVIPNSSLGGPPSVDPVHSEPTVQ
jgi:hypothetical protein